MPPSVTVARLNCGHTVTREHTPSRVVSDCVLLLLLSRIAPAMFVSLCSARPCLRPSELCLPIRSDRPFHRTDSRFAIVVYTRMYTSRFHKTNAPTTVTRDRRRRRCSGTRTLCSQPRSVRVGACTKRTTAHSIRTLHHGRSATAPRRFAVRRRK